MPSSERSYTIALFLSAVVIFGGAPAAEAQATIERARELWFDADFEAADAAFNEVLTRPSLTRVDALDAHRFLAALALVLDDEARARTHADIAVALDADVTPPEGAPNSATALFRMAKRRLGGREAALTLEPTDTARYGQSVDIVARMDPAPSGLVSRITVRCGAAETEGPAPSVTLSLEADEDVPCVARARTASGATLFEATLALAVTGRPAARVAERVPGTADEPERNPRRGRRIAIITTVAALAVGGAVVTGLLVYDRNHGDVRFAGTTVVGW
jgi:hypothetical protein